MGQVHVAFTLFSKIFNELFFFAQSESAITTLEKSANSESVQTELIVNLFFEQIVNLVFCANCEPGFLRKL